MGLKGKGIALIYLEYGIQYTCFSLTILDFKKK